MLAILGPAIIAVGAFLILRNVLFLRKASSAEGVVASNRSAGSNRYNPVVRFEAADGKTYEFEDTSFSSNPPAYEIGTQVPVKYDPTDPSRGRINRPVRLWGVGAALVLVGIVVTTL